MLLFILILFIFGFSISLFLLIIVELFVFVFILDDEVLFLFIFIIAFINWLLISFWSFPTLDEDTELLLSFCFFNDGDIYSLVSTFFNPPFFILFNSLCKSKGLLLLLFDLDWLEEVLLKLTGETIFKGGGTGIEPFPLLIEGTLITGTGIVVWTGCWLTIVLLLFILTLFILVWLLLFWIWFFTIVCWTLLISLLFFGVSLLFILLFTLIFWILFKLLFISFVFACSFLFLKIFINWLLISFPPLLFIFSSPGFFNAGETYSLTSTFFKPLFLILFNSFSKSVCSLLSVFELLFILLLLGIILIGGGLGTELEEGIGLAIGGGIGIFPDFGFGTAWGTFKTGGTGIGIFLFWLLFVFDSVWLLFLLFKL